MLVVAVVGGDGDSGGKRDSASHKSQPLPPPQPPAKYVIREARLKIPRRRNPVVSRKLAFSPSVSTCHSLDGLNDAPPPTLRLLFLLLFSLFPANIYKRQTATLRSNASKSPGENNVTFFVLRKHSFVLEGRQSQESR